MQKPNKIDRLELMPLSILALGALAMWALTIIGGIPFAVGLTSPFILGPR
jgi:hypothetical protein